MNPTRRATAFSPLTSALDSSRADAALGYLQEDLCPGGRAISLPGASEAGKEFLCPALAHLCLCIGIAPHPNC